MKACSTRFTAKPTTSLTLMGTLPTSRLYCISASTVSSAVSMPGMTSTSFMRDTGEK